MRKFATLLAALCICSWGTATALAGGAGCAAAAKKAAASGGCPFSGKSACMSGDEFPAMSTMVGDQKFECPVEAGKAAEKAHGKVVFVVAGEKFDSQDKAMSAYACAAECYAKRFVSIAYEKDGKWMTCDGEDCCKGEKTAMAAGCSHGKGDAAMASAKGECSHAKGAAMASAKGECTHAKGKGEMTAAKGECSHAKNAAAMAANFPKGTRFRVAGRIYNSFEDAHKASMRAREAIRNIKVTYRVDGKDVADSKDVCPTAKASGKVVYVVGSESTPCEMTARVKMAKAQVEAAKKSLDQLARA